MSITKKSKVKEVTTDMPVAIALMILLGSKELRKTYVASECKERLAMVLEPLVSEIDHLPEDIFRNNNIHLTDNDDVYKEFYENREQYHFDNLIAYLHFFYTDDISFSQINGFEDIKRCYQVIETHQTKTANTRFTPDFCWKIASFFLNEYSEPHNSDDVYERRVSSYEDVRDTYPIRKEMVKSSSGDVYIAGTTLKDAFSTSNSNKNISIIHDLIQNDKIKKIYIFILNYKYMGINQESASKEIENSLTNIMDVVLKADDYCPKVEIILLNSFNIPFALIAHDQLLIRSTYIFDYARHYRGQYLLFNSNDLEYKSIKDYFDDLIKHAYELDMSPLTSFSDVVKQKYIHDEFAYKEKGLKIKKIHPVQLDNLVRASFNKSDNGKEPRDFSITPYDKTQSILLPYLSKTEELLDTLVRMHDPNGWAKIIPCNDLGFPNNIMKIAGGFLTGAYYNWLCAVPIVPVDATINTCTSSVFKLKGFDADTLDNKSFETIVRKICASAMETGYAFSFESGNHFLIISKDDFGNYYLVLHCSAKQAKESCFGLYPTEKVWYKNKIKTLYSKDQTRYIRYVRSDTAVKFVDYANRFRDFNQEMHQYIAEEFAFEVGAEIVGQPNIKHHYGMPTSNSIAIGTFVVDTRSTNDSDLILPVFSELGKDICIYSVSRRQGQTYTPPGTSQKIILVPHGWGQVIDDIKLIRVENVSDEKDRQLILETNVCHQLDVTPQNRIAFPEKHVRLFSSIEDFLKEKCSHINGHIKTIMHPVYCFCSRTVKSKDFHLDKK
ncbi:MAG: hypothetical protein K2H93_01045 [Oscillospiraceae bacterium]|nr:hypothetical protein [Oscillospiraceae bacterium]MDE6706615.1 hypothetical protein [Oscillospiraceae bacterium]